MAHTVRQRPIAKGESGYLPEAPAALISLHQQIGPGKDVLGRLLTDKKMNRAWKELIKRIKPGLDHEWRRLWSEIVYALRLTKLDRSELLRRRETYKSIATSAGQLATYIEDKPLDLPIYEMFDDQAMRINGVDGWGNMGSLQRSDKAYRLLCEWPTASECLRELAARAEQFARTVMSTVPVERTTRDRNVRIFIRWMSMYFDRQFNQPLHAVVAAIATVVLSRPVTPDVVEQNTRRWKKQKTRK